MSQEPQHYFISVDAGPKGVRVASHTSQKDPAEVADRTFVLGQSLDGNFARIVGTINDLVGVGQVLGIGFAVDGRVDHERQNVTSSLTAYQLIGMFYVDRLRGLFCDDVVLGTRMEAAAMADARFGVARDEGDFLAIRWDDTFEATLIRHLHGCVYSWAGNAGHVRVDISSGWPCSCGQRGCLEAALCSGEAVPWDTKAELVAMFIRNAVSLQPVGVVVLSGGVVDRREEVVTKIRQLVSDDMSCPHPPRVLYSRFSGPAGNAGALALLGLSV